MPKELASAMRAEDPGLHVRLPRAADEPRDKNDRRSRKVPVGSFVAGSRSMRPPCGSGVAAVASASASAREFAQRRVSVGGHEKRRTIGHDRVELSTRRVCIGKHPELPTAARHPRGARIVARASRNVCATASALSSRERSHSQDPNRRRRCARASSENPGAPCRRRSRSVRVAAPTNARRPRRRRRRRCGRHARQRRSP